jgi:hypothetical protein
VCERSTTSDQPTTRDLSNDDGTGWQVFGAFVTHPWYRSEKFYGSGETFLFSISPTEAAYKWQTGNQYYFQRASDSSMTIGGGNGYALRQCNATQRITSHHIHTTSPHLTAWWWVERVSGLITSCGTVDRPSAPRSRTNPYTPTAPRSTAW